MSDIHPSDYETMVYTMESTVTLTDSVSQTVPKRTQKQPGIPQDGSLQDYPWFMEG